MSMLPRFLGFLLFGGICFVSLDTDAQADDLMQDFSLRSSASSNAAPSSPLTAFYPSHVMDAYFSGDAALLVAVLEQELQAFEKKHAADPALRANFRLFLAHAYDDFLGQPVRAAPHYRAAADALSHVPPIPSSIAKAVTVVATQRIQEELTPEPTWGLYRELHAPGWAALKRGWIEYVDLGIKGGDSAARAKGEAMLRKDFKGSRWLEERRIIKLGKQETTLDGVTFGLAPLHPNQVDLRVAYSLPVLPDLTVVTLTITNSGNELVALTADDVAMHVGGKIYASLQDEAILAAARPGPAYEAFVYSELSPFTFSELPVKDYDSMLVAQYTADEARRVEAEEKAKLEAILAAGRASRAMWASIGNSIGNVGMEMSRGVDSASASQYDSDSRNYRAQASQARSAGNYSGALALESSARWKASEAKSLRENIDSGRSKFAAEQRYYQDEMAAASAKANSANERGRGSMGGISSSWNASLRQKLMNIEYTDAGRRAYAKLEGFALSPVFLPKRGAAISKEEHAVTVGELMAGFDTKKKTDMDDLAAAIRVRPGETWRGVVCFQSNAPTGKGKITVGFVHGGKRKAFALPAEIVTTLAIRPPLLTFAERPVGPSRQWGDAFYAPVDYGWFVLQPVLSPY